MLKITFKPFLKGIRKIDPDENCPLVRLGVSIRLRVSLRVGGNQTIAPEENCPLVRVRL